MLLFIVFNDSHTTSLIERAQKGDEAAFCELIEKIQPFVYNLALRMMNGNSQDAEDMSQEAFLRVYKALPKYKEDASLKTWSLRICKNICIDEIRHRTAVELQTDELNELVADKTDVQEQVSAKERRAELVKAINSLDERSRMLIVMRDINGLSYKEICDAAEMNEGTVKSALNRARKKLKEKLLQGGTNFI